MKETKKTWGKELIIANSQRYAGKVLGINKEAVSSVHRHLVKDETMLCIEGNVLLVVGDRTYWLEPYSDPVHIPPGAWHMFVGLEDSKIVEVSTEHKEEDVKRVTRSKAGDI